MTRDELIARLEKLTGPDRELDVAIALSQPSRWPRRASQRPGRIVTDYGNSTGTAQAPRYTERVDDALRLVPEHCTVSLFSTCDPLWWAEVRALGVGSHIDWPNPEKHSTADTAAVAICIACLRAKDSQP